MVSACILKDKIPLPIKEIKILLNVIRGASVCDEILTSPDFVEL